MYNLTARWPALIAYIVNHCWRHCNSTSHYHLTVCLSQLNMAARLKQWSKNEVIMFSNAKKCVTSTSNQLVEVYGEDVINW